MKETTLTPIVFLIVLPVAVVAMWAMLMMTVGAFNDERFTLFRLFTGYFVQEQYNRKFLRIFATCVAILVGFVIIFNVLFLVGVIKP